MRGRKRERQQEEKQSGEEKKDKQGYEIMCECDGRTGEEKG